MKKVDAIVQVRMGSSRLPGKTMLPILGKPVIQLLLERLRFSSRINDIIVATTIRPEDDVINDFCKSNDIICSRGSSEDVLGRVYAAATKFNSDVIVDVTGDCPLLDPWLIDECIDIFLKSDFDYFSNFVTQSYPPGIDVQILNFKVLEEMHYIAREPKFREHVTLFILANKNKYNIHNYLSPAEFNFPDWHLELDEEGDYRLIKRIYEALYPLNNKFSTLDILNILKKNPAWLKDNKNVKRVWEKVREESGA